MNQDDVMCVCNDQSMNMIIEIISMLHSRAPTKFVHATQIVVAIVVSLAT